MVNVEEGSERSLADGDGRNEGLGEVPRVIDPRYRDLGTESVYEYGSRAGIFRLLRLFDRLGVQTTAFAAAMALERNPDAAAWLVESGHEICAHGYRWSEEWTMSATKRRGRSPRGAIRSRRTCGQRPVGWYSALDAEHAHPPAARRRGRIPLRRRRLQRRHPLLRASGRPVAARRAVLDDLQRQLLSLRSARWPWRLPRLLPAGLDYLAAEDDGAPRMMSIGLHPRLSGQAARASAVAEFLGYALGRDDVWVATRVDIARYWHKHFPPPADPPGAVA